MKLCYVGWSTIEFALASGRVGCDTRPRTGTTNFKDSAADWIFSDNSILPESWLKTRSYAAVAIHETTNLPEGPFELRNVEAIYFPTEERQQAFLADLRLQGLDRRLNVSLRLDANLFNASPIPLSGEALAAACIVSSSWRTALAFQERVSAAVLTAETLLSPRLKLIEQLRGAEAPHQLHRLVAWCKASRHFIGAAGPWAAEEVITLAPELRENGFIHEADALLSFSSPQFGEDDPRLDLAAENTVLAAALRVLFFYPSQRSDDLPMILMNAPGLTLPVGVSISDLLLYISVAFGRISMPFTLIPGLSRSSTVEDLYRSKWLDLARQEIDAVRRDMPPLQYTTFATEQSVRNVLLPPPSAGEVDQPKRKSRKKPKKAGPVQSEWSDVMPAADNPRGEPTLTQDE